MGCERLDDLKVLQTEFGLHPLALEDCVHIRQRPKVDNFRENLFLVCKTVNLKKGQCAEDQQLGMFLGKNFVVTVHDGPMPQLNEVLDDIKRKKPQLVEGSPSFLLYSILDAVVDNLEETVREVEDFESRVGIDVLKEPPPADVLNQMYTNRSNLLLVGRLLRPQSEVIHRLISGGFRLISKETSVFFGDTYDHTLRTLDRIDGLLDMNMGSLNIYLSSVSNRMNQVMRLLTVISTIGVPLTILVGWYGMNFGSMPELNSPYGYLSVIVIAVVIVSIILFWFRKKGWV